MCFCLQHVTICFVIDMLLLVIILSMDEFFMGFRVDSSDYKVFNRTYYKNFLLSNIGLE